MPAQEIDYFALHNRKPRDIHVEMLDYDHVDNCTDIDELKGILALLRSGKEGRYVQLEQHTEKRILQVLPEYERKKILRMKNGPTSNEVASEEAELASWESSMQSTSAELLQTSKKLSTRTMPPVRGQKCNKKTISESKAKKVSKAEKISAYNWRAWEKYDVDAALQEIDHEEHLTKEAAKAAVEKTEARAKQRRKELESLPASVNLSEMSSIERKVCATKEKQKGNECFKAGETEEALLYYTRSLAYDDSCAVIYSNRALGHLKLKNFQSAEEDCTRAINLDPTFTKAWIRRGMTRHRRGKYKEAIGDFERALEIGPSNNADLRRLLEKTRQKWKQVEGEQFNKIQIVEEDSEEEEQQQPVEEEEKKEECNNAFQRIQIVEETTTVPAPKIEILEEY